MASPNHTLRESGINIKQSTQQLPSGANCQAQYYLAPTGQTEKLAAHDNFRGQTCRVHRS